MAVYRASESMQMACFCSSLVTDSVALDMAYVAKTQPHEIFTPEARVQSQTSPTVICTHVEKRPLDVDRSRGDRRVGILIKLRQG